MRRNYSLRSESTVHREVCDYLRLQYPGALFRSDFASGLKLTMNQAVQHKRLQSSRAWPDLMLYEPVGKRQGLALELKKDGVVVFKKDGTLRKDEHLEEQAEMLQELRERGYVAEFAVGFDDARWHIDQYMAGNL